MSISHVARSILGETRFAWLKRFAKALTCSVVGTVLSQAALLGLLAMETNSTTASLAAFLAGAIPNYFLSRRWAWGRDRKPDLRTELLPYIVVVAATGLLATGLTTLTDLLIRPLDLSQLLRVVLLDATFLGSYGVVFVLKFTLLDKLVFRRSTPRSTPTAATAVSEPATAAAAVPARTAEATSSS